MHNDDRGQASAVALAVLAFIVIAAVCVAGYIGYWWVAKDSKDRQSDINRHSYEQQTTYRDEIARQIADVARVDAQIVAAPADQIDALRHQRTAMVEQACRVASHIVGDTDPATAHFTTHNC